PRRQGASGLPWRSDAPAGAPAASVEAVLDLRGLEGGVVVVLEAGRRVTRHDLVEGQDGQAGVDSEAALDDVPVVVVGGGLHDVVGRLAVLDVEVAEVELRLGLAPVVGGGDEAGLDAARVLGVV